MPPLRNQQPTPEGDRELISLDTETTGLDLRHGAKPYYVTMCNGAGAVTAYEWEVDPFTRDVKVESADLDQIEARLRDCGGVVLQNSKFDVTALNALRPGLGDRWPWEKTRDTLLAAHLLTSNHQKDLTALGVRWLGVDIEPKEQALKAACHSARRMCRTKTFVDEYGEWAIAKAGRPDMPSAGEDDWKADGWLPRTIAKLLGYAAPADGCDHQWDGDSDLCHRCDGHLWWVVLSEYADADSAVTLALYSVLRREVHRRKLRKIYDGYSLKLPRVAYKMEKQGITYSEARLSELRAEYKEESDARHAVCINIAKTFKGPDGEPYQLHMGKGVTNSLRTFVWDVMGLEKIVAAKSQTGNPSLDSKTAIPTTWRPLTRGRGSTRSSSR
jgi:DNA polymerase I-like protein with 3'-5' exonuclease and polymerase domains